MKIANTVAPESSSATVEATENIAMSTKNLAFTSRIKYLFLVALLGILAVSGNAQSNQPLASTPGAPAGSYRLSDFDSVNLFSGNVNISLPLTGLKGRGASGVGVSLNIENQWQLNQLAEYEYQISNKPVDILGTVGRVTIRSNSRGPLESCSEAPTWWAEDSLNVTVVLPDGTEQMLIDPYKKGEARGCTNGAPLNENYGTFFQSTDGTFTTFIADADIYSIGGMLGLPVESPVSGYLYRNDGSKTRVDDGKIVWIQDRNGNRSTITYDPNYNLPNYLPRPTLLTDSLGREIEIEYSVTESAPVGLCHRITYRGTNGEERIIRVSLGTTTRSAVSGTDDDFELTDMITTDPYAEPQVRADLISWNLLPKAVWLPDGRTYEFEYNVNGRIAEVKLPTGGKMQYDFYPSVQSSPNQWAYFANRVKEKRVLDENDSLLSKTIFTKGGATGPSWYGCQINPSWCTYQTVITVENKDAGNNLLKKSRHYFYGNADGRQTFLSWAGHHWWGSFDGKEQMTEELDLDGSTVLNRIERTFRPKISADCYYDPNFQNPCGLSSYPHVPNSSPMVVETRTTLVDTNQVSLVTSINPSTQVPALDS